MSEFTEGGKIPQLPCKLYLSNMESGKIMKKLQRLLQDPSHPTHILPKIPCDLIVLLEATWHPRKVVIPRVKAPHHVRSRDVRLTPLSFRTPSMLRKSLRCLAIWVIEEKHQNKTKHTSSIINYHHLSMIARPFLLHVCSTKLVVQRGLTALLIPPIHSSP